MESIGLLFNTASSIAHTITDKFLPHEPTITLADIIKQEEDERNLRTIHPAQAKLQMENAARVSSLVSQAPHPFAVQRGKGFRAITHGLEEAERRRRINTKAEYQLRRVHANKVAGIVRSLGWPFYQHDLFKGPVYSLVDPTALAEEEERAYRIANPLFVMTAKNNGAIVSSLIRCNGPQCLTSSKRFTRHLEEQERKRRLASPEEVMWASDNALIVSHLLRMKDLLQAEEQERAYRMSAPELQNAHIEAGLVERALLEQTIAGAHARRLAGLTQSTDGLRIGKESIVSLEERERERRMRDPISQFHAIGLAKQLSGLVSGLSSVRAPVESPMEIERQRRMYDRQGNLLAVRNARKVSNLIASRYRRPSYVSAVTAEERERSRRIREQHEKELAIDNARKVSSFVRAAPRRARSESAIIRPSFPSAAVASRLPTQNMSMPSSPVPTSPMPEIHFLSAEPLAAAPSPVGRSYKACPDMMAVPQLPAPVVKKLAASVVQTAADPSSASTMRAPPGFDPLPAFSRRSTNGCIPLQHSASAPNLVGTVNTSPSMARRTVNMPAALFSQTPIVGAPIQSAYVRSCESQPLRSALRNSSSAITDASAAHVTFAPLPVASAAPRTPFSVAPSNYSFPQHSYQPPASFNSLPLSAFAVPSSSYPPVTPSPAGQLSEKEQKRLEKTASRHAKIADKAAKRAEKELAKAEKLHLAGKDSRAVRYQNKAEQHSAISQQHADFAANYQKELTVPIVHSGPSAPGILTAGRPNM